MNNIDISSIVNNTNFKIAILLLYAVIAVVVFSYNWLYLYHSLHVSSKHMGLNAPPSIRRVIKLCIVIAGITVVMIAFFLLFRIY